MKHLTLRRRLATGALGLGLAVAVAACMPADGETQTIAVAGSDTTQDVMEAIAANSQSDSSRNTDPDVLNNILSQEPGGTTVPGDANCATRTYRTPPGAGEFAPPNGSSAGRDALRLSVQNGDGCIDVARSSSGPRAIGSDLATFEYNAFGLDAVAWASASGRAPANLTLSQLQGIYNCTFTNWSQVGGSAGPIQRYWVQAGSGTRAFAQSDLLGGFDPTTVSTPSCPAAIISQENTGQLIAANGDQLTAVVPYSGANFVAQTRGTAPDQRSGQTIRSINGQNIITGSGATTKLNVAGPVTEDNVRLNDPTPAYPGVRYVFNVLDSTSVKYDQSNRYFGFQNQDKGTASPLCQGTYAQVIESFGFGPLDKTTSARNVIGSSCRRFNP